MASTTTGILFASPGDPTAAHISDPVDAHDASAISVVPVGGLAANDVQEALEEHQADISMLVSGAVFRGGFDATSGTFPGGGLAQAGWWYITTVGGTVGGQTFNVGDHLYASTNGASTSTYAGNWVRVQTGVGTTNTLTAGSDQITSTVNAVAATLTPTPGTIAVGKVLGFDSGGALVLGASGGTGVIYAGTVPNAAGRLALPDSPGQVAFQANGGFLGKGALFQQYRTPSSSNAAWIEIGAITYGSTADTTITTADVTFVTADITG